MEGYKHYIRVNEVGIVVHGFSNAFEQPQSGDLQLSGDHGRHFQLNLHNERGQFKYKVVDGQMAERTQTELDSERLPSVKEEKLLELSAIETERLKIFQSSALGTPHTYVLATETKNFFELFNGEFTFLNSPLYDGTSTTLWFTVEKGNVPHTKAQFNQVYADARAHVQNTKYQRANLEAQVKPATTIAAVNAIVW